MSFVTLVFSAGITLPRLGITGRKIDQANSLLWVRKAKVIVKNVGGGVDCPERYDDGRAPWAWWLLTKSLSES